MDKSNAKHAHDECSCHACDTQHEHTTDRHTSVTHTAAWLAASLAAAVPAFFISGAVPSFFLWLLAVLLAGFPVFRKGVRNIVHFVWEELALLTVAVAAAFCIGEMPEAFLVTFLFRVGEMLEDLSISRSRRAVDAITQIIPDNANRLTAEGVKTVPAASLAPGDNILIRLGERVPVDCRILSGSSTMDCASLTGESAPQEVHAGDTLLSGVINLGGVLTCHTLRTLENSAASKIVALTRDAQTQKSRTERLISRFARIYTPIIMLLTLLTAIVPPLLGLGSFSDWIRRALVILVASCPCALVISVPLSFFSGMGACSKAGALVKSSQYLEAMAQAKSVVFDKTGTLTTGQLEVTALHPAPDIAPERLLAWAAACEQGASHPIAQAVVRKAQGLSRPAVYACEETAAKGVTARTADGTFLCGSAAFLAEHGLSTATFPPANLYLAQNGRLIGAIEVRDDIRTDAAATVDALRQFGIQTCALLTGDRADVAKETARAIGIDTVCANLLPGDKVKHLEDIQQKTTAGTTVFVGDGINDSPVIARADCGVAMGSASDAALEASDVVLLSNRLSTLPRILHIARRTGRLAHTNISFALTIKFIVLILAFAGLGQMWMAVLADVGVSILTSINATRALKFR